MLTVAASDEQNATSVAAPLTAPTPTVLESTTWADITDLPSWMPSVHAGEYLLIAKPMGIYGGTACVIQLRVAKVSGGSTVPIEGSEVLTQPMPTGHYCSPVLHLSVQHTPGDTYKFQYQMLYGTAKLDLTYAGIPCGSRVFQLLH